MTFWIEAGIWTDVKQGIALPSVKLGRITVKYERKKTCKFSPPKKKAVILSLKAERVNVVTRSAMSNAIVHALLQ